MGGTRVKYCVNCGTPMISAGRICPLCRAEQPDPGSLPAPRRWGWALLLGLLLPGAGQLYNGRLVRALAVHLLLLAAGIGAGLAVLQAPGPVRLGLVAGVWLALWLGTATAAALAAARQGRDYRRRAWQGPSVYLAALAAALLLVDPLALHEVATRLFAPLQVQTPWMAPTLEAGDWVLVDKYSAAARHPARGDLVAYSLGKGTAGRNSPTLVERIVGMPGDMLGMQDKQLYINGIPVMEIYAVHDDPGELPAALSQRDNFGPLRVPTGSYFVLGDNRDDSLDSRFWGFVPAADLRGRPRLICWSRDAVAGAVRWVRIGRKVE